MNNAIRVLPAAFSLAVSCWTMAAVAQTPLPQFEVRDLTRKQSRRGPEYDYSRIVVQRRSGGSVRFDTTSLMRLGAPLQNLQNVPVRTDVKEVSHNTLELSCTPERQLSTTQAERLKAELEVVLQRVRQHPEVATAHFGLVARPHNSGANPPNDPFYRTMWHYHRSGPHAAGTSSPGGINLPLAWPSSTGSKRIVVAVLDTGIVAGHQDFGRGANIVAGYDFVSSPVSAGDGDGRDAYPTDPGDDHPARLCGPFDPGETRASWHGSHVAGTIGAGAANNGVGITGVNWQVSVQPVRVLGKCGGAAADVADGIRWAAGLPVPGVPANRTPARVINLSLGFVTNCRASTRPEIVRIRNAIAEAHAAGALIVASAGNDGSDAANVTPASCPNVFTVAASDARGHLARYSSYGTVVDILAPGGDVRRDDNRDNIPDGVLSYAASDGYQMLNGTSMAAPHVAGVAALLLARNPRLTPSRLTELMRRFAIPARAFPVSAALRRRASQRRDHGRSSELDAGRDLELRATLRRRIARPAPGRAGPAVLV